MKGRSYCLLKSASVLILVLSTLFAPLVPLGVSLSPTISMDPPFIGGLVPGDTFDINLVIVDAENVYAWQAVIAFKPFSQVIIATGATEGGFLKIGGDTFFPNPAIDNSKGSIGVSCTISEAGAGGVSGSGTLATISFKVVGGGDSPLDLQDTKLLDPDNNEMQHNVVSGYFLGSAPYAFFKESPNPVDDGYEPAVNSTVTFNATDSYDPDGGNIVSYFWDFGDGTSTTVTEPIVQHVYTKPQVDIVVNLTITDSDDSLSDSHTKTVTVVVRDIAVTRIELSPSGKVKAGTSVSINVTVENIGTGSENFDVKAYYNDVPIDTQSVTKLNPRPPSPPWRHIKSLIFNWDTTGLSGEYTIKATAYTSPGENNITNNELVDGNITVSITSKLLYTVTAYSATFSIVVETDSDVADFAFNYAAKTIGFEVSGSQGTLGYSNVTIPMSLLNASDPTAWIVRLNSTVSDYFTTSNGTHYFVYFNYTFSSIYTATIVGTEVAIPPQPSFTMSNSTPFVGQPVTLNGSSTIDPDGYGISEYFWHVYRLDPLGGKANIWNTTTTTPVTTVTFNESRFGSEAPYVTLTATNNLGLKNTTSEQSINIIWPYDVAIVKIAVSNSTLNVGEGLLVNITVTSRLNTHGDGVTFKTDIFGNDTALTTQLTNPLVSPPEILMPPYGSNRTVTYKWDTTGVTLGTYKLKATVTIVQYGIIRSLPPEPNLDDNTLVYGDVRVKKSDSIIIAVVSPSTVTVGSFTKISGSVSPKRAGANVTIQSRLGTTGAWINVATVTIGTQGVFVYTWTPLSAGVYQVRAIWSGDATTSANTSAPMNFEVRQLISTVSLEVDSTSTSIGSSVIVSGEITPERASTSVIIRARKDGGEWTSIATVATDSQGSYSYEWKPTEAGTYEIQAVWNGDVNTLGSESETITVTVQPGFQIPYVYIGVGVAVVLVVAVAFYLLRKRRS